MKKMVRCRVCEQKIAKSAKTCPHCGAKNKKSFFKRLIFLVLVVAVLAAVIYNNRSDARREYMTSTGIETENYDSVGEKATENTMGIAMEQTENENTEAVETEAVETEPVETEEITENKENDIKLVDGMRPEFKEALDSYEEFFDKYCTFMEKYAKNPTDLGLLTDYATFMTQYADTMEKLDALDDGSMNDAETQYYIKVTSRITQKLLEIPGVLD